MSGVDVDGNVYAISLDNVINKVTMETIPTVAAISDLSDYYDNDYAVVIGDIVLVFQKGKGRNVDIDVDYLAADLSEQDHLEFLGEELYAETGIDFNKYPGYVSELAELRQKGYTEEEIDKYVEEDCSNIEQEFDLFVALPYLRKQIIEQAKNMGIPREALEFP